MMSIFFRRAQYESPAKFTCAYKNTKQNYEKKGQ